MDKYDEKQEWSNLSCVTLDEGTSIWCCKKCYKILEDNPKSTVKNLKSLVKDQDEENNEIIESNENTENKVILVKESRCCLIC